MKAKKYILAIDQSTSATKAMLFNKKAELVERVSVKHKQFYPEAGFVEHDAEEIFENTINAIKEIIRKAKCNENEISGIAITNQRETSLIWDKTTGKPIAKAAVWQCQRGVEFCNELKASSKSDLIKEKTGLIIDPYFSASKLRWIIENTKGAKQKRDEGKLLAGTMDSWLLWKLTGCKVFATDFSNASRTMLLDLNSLTWDDELTELFSLRKSMLPELKYNDEIFGYTDPSVIFNEPIPIAGLLGDSHAALFGQNCFEKGTAKATYGTGSSIMMNIGNSPLPPPEGLVTSVGFGLNKMVDFVFEGNIHCTGDTINWLVGDLQLIESAKESEELATSVEDNNGVYFVPAFVGLGAPYWDNSARAAISGMARNTKKAHVVRAALESIAYQIKDVIDLMISKSGIELKVVNVDGGPTRNNFLMQFQANALDRTIVRTDIEEISALGTAFMAGLATGFWKDLDEISQLRVIDRTFDNQMDKETRNKLYTAWETAVKRVRLT